MSISVENFYREYKSLVNRLGQNSSDDALVQLLTKESDWTREGAVTLVSLARQHGAFILRNALALAEAMEIEDGSLGM